MKAAIIKLTFIKPLVLTFFLLFMLSGNILSQENDLSYAYYNAVNLYNMGKIDTAYNILSSSLTNKKLYRKTSKNTRANIYRLSALSCILLEQQYDARVNIKKMLAFNPYYENNFREGDLLEFRRTVEEFTVLPRIVIGVNYFRNYSTISVEKSLTDHSSDYVPQITGLSEYGGGLSVENAFTKRLSVGLGINLFISEFSYKGVGIPLAADHKYDLNFRFIETPVYADYKLRYDKKLRPYFRLAVLVRFYPKQKETYNIPHRYKSSDYGRFYMQEEKDNAYNSILALFFQNYEYLDIVAGGGVSYNFKRSCINLNIGYTPFQIKTHPLDQVNAYDDIPGGELFKSADETIVVDIKRLLRFTLSYKYFWNYKAF